MKLISHWVELSHSVHFFFPIPVFVSLQSVSCLPHQTILSLSINVFLTSSFSPCLLVRIAHTNEAFSHSHSPVHCLLFSDRPDFFLLHLNHPQLHNITHDYSNMSIYMCKVKSQKESAGEETPGESLIAIITIVCDKHPTFLGFFKHLIRDVCCSSMGSMAK